MLAIRAPRAFDGARLVDGGVVLMIDDGKIVGAGREPRPVPDGIEVVDHPDATVVPGLIDTHVHLCGDSLDGALTGSAAYDDAELAA